MKRRSFLVVSVATVTAGMLIKDALAEPLDRLFPPMDEDPILPEDLLNPSGVRTAGIRMLPVANGKYKVWTKRLGSGPVKVLLLHGGPGFSHEYLEAFESFLPEAGIEMYYYDQLGCNNSDQPEDASLWTLPRYLDEVEEVRRLHHLGIDRPYRLALVARQTTFGQRHTRRTCRCQHRAYRPVCCARHRRRPRLRQHLCARLPVIQHVDADGKSTKVWDSAKS